MRVVQRLLACLVCFLVAVLSPLGRAEAQPVDTVLNIDFELLNFGTPTRVSGGNLAAGAVYRYTNIITLEGRRIDADVTIVSLGPCSLGTFDGTTNPARFEPTIACTAAGAIEFLIEFFDADRTRVALRNFYATGIDIDGGGLL